VFVTVDAASCLNRLRFAAWDVCIIDSAIPDAKYVKKRVRAEQLGVEVRLIHRFAERPADLADQISPPSIGVEPARHAVRRLRSGTS
jgi:hypothetical protein